MWRSSSSTRGTASAIRPGGTPRLRRLLGISRFVLAVNKMDLVDFDEAVFDSTCADFSGLLGDAQLHAIPLSALHGDNVITRSDRTPWFDGFSLLEYLETVDVDGEAAGRPFRFPVQLAVRPDHEFRGSAGQIAAGMIRVGDPVTIWPAGRTTRIGRIVTWDGDLDEAFAPMSVTLVFEDDIDVSRGDIVATGDIQVADRFTAQVVWMDERALDPRRTYLLKHTTRTVTAEVDCGLELNQIGPVTLTTSRPLVFDRYGENRTTGSFVLIDPATNFTAGAGMIAGAVRGETTIPTTPAAAERLARAARSAATETDAIDAVRRVLEEILI